MSSDLNNLIFGKPLEVALLFGPTERSYFGGFVNKYLPAEDPKGRRMYVHSSKGFAVWESPETILGLLLANKYIPTSLIIERWISIPKSPLIIIDCGDGRLLLGNKINGRVKLDVDEALWPMVGREIEKELKGQNYFHDDTKDYAHPVPILDVLLMLQQKPSKPIDRETGSPIVTDEEKKAFFDSLKDNSIPILGDYEKLFENLISKSRDPRLHAIPQDLRGQLLLEYISSQKKMMEEQAKQQREVVLIEWQKLLEQYRGLCEAWQKQYASSIKLKGNYSLFKEKYRHDKTFKEATKYFDLEKLFKEWHENTKSGAISGTEK